MLNQKKKKNLGKIKETSTCNVGITDHLLNALVLVCPFADEPQTVRCYVCYLLL